MPGLRKSPRLCRMEEAKKMGEASLAKSKKLLPMIKEGAAESHDQSQDTSHDSGEDHKSVPSRKARQLSPRRDSHTPKVLIVPLVTDSGEEEDDSPAIPVEQSLSDYVVKAPLVIVSDEEDSEELPVEKSDSTAKHYSSQEPPSSCVDWANISTSTVMDKFLPGTSMNPVHDTFHDPSMEDISVDMMKRKRENPGLVTVPSKSSPIKIARHKSPSRNSHLQNILIVSGPESDSENNFPFDQPKSNSSVMQHPSPEPSSSSSGAGWTKIRTSTVTDKLLPGISMMRTLATTPPPQPKNVRRGLATVDMQTVSAGVDADPVNSNKIKSRKELLAGLNGVSVTNIQGVQDQLSGVSGEVELMKIEQGLGRNVEEAKVVDGMVFDLSSDDDDDDDVQEVKNVGFVNPWIKDEGDSPPLQPGVCIGPKFFDGSFTIKAEGKAQLTSKPRGMGSRSVASLARGRGTGGQSGLTGRILQGDNMPGGYQFNSQYSPLRRIVLPGAVVTTPRGRAVRASTPRGRAVRASTPRGRVVPSPVMGLGPGRGDVRSRGGRGVGGNMAVMGGMRGRGFGAHLIPSPQQVVNSDSWMMHRTPTSGRSNISSPRVDVSLVIPAFGQHSELKIELNPSQVRLLKNCLRE